MKTFTLALTLMLLTSLCGLSQRRIEVRLLEDNQKVALNSDFKLYLIVNDSTNTESIVTCVVDKNTFVLPEISHSKILAVVFQHGHSSCRLPVKDLSVAQNARWEFTVDRKPYSRQYMNPEADNINTEAVMSLMVQPLKGGNQEEFMIAVADMKSMRREVDGVAKKANKQN